MEEVFFELATPAFHLHVSMRISSISSELLNLWQHTVLCWDGMTRWRHWLSLKSFLSLAVYSSSPCWCSHSWDSAVCTSFSFLPASKAWVVVYLFVVIFFQVACKERESAMMERRWHRARALTLESQKLSLTKHGHHVDGWPLHSGLHAHPKISLESKSVQTLQKPFGWDLSEVPCVCKRMQKDCLCMLMILKSVGGSKHMKGLKKKKNAYLLFLIDKIRFFWTFYVFGSCFRMLAVTLVLEC